MKKSVLTLATACLLAAPAATLAQGVGIAGRVGTLGAGAEVAVGLTDAFVIRGGIGLLPLKPSANISDIDFTLTLPKSWYNIGVDLYIAGPMRIGAGMLFKPDNFDLEGVIGASTSVTIGDKTYTASDVAKLNGTLASKKQAPYVLIGFGKHTSSGIGLFLDLGAAFVGDPTVSLSATGNPTIVNSADFQSELRKQETKIENDVGTYLKIWPIINLGLRIGVG